MKKLRKLAKPIISLLVILSMVLSLPTPVIAQTMLTESIDSIPMSDATSDEVEVEQGNIIGEDKTLRDEYTKYFITDTGCTVVAQYNVPVHYKDEKGNFVNYDNTLITSQAYNTESSTDEASVDEISTFSLRSSDEKEEVFVNRKSDTKVSHFKKSGKAKLIEITRDGHTVSWGYSGANIVSAEEKESTQKETLTGNDAYLTARNLSSKIVYENIYNNIDLEVINSTAKVKENLILKASNVKNVFKIEYNIGELTAENVDDQTIELKDVSGKVVYTISAPYMTDATGEKSEALTLKILANNKGKLSVKLTADKSWLKDKDRVYPIIIDPDFEYRADVETVDCTFIESKDPDTPNGNEQSVYVGADGNEDELRALIKMDNLNSLFSSDRIKMGDMIVAATIEFYLWSDDLFTTSYVGAYRITDDWDVNNVTWNDFGTAGYDKNNLIDYEVFDNTMAEEMVSWDITELVKLWYSGTTNNGFMLKMVDGTPVNQCIDLCSSNFDNDANLEEGDARPIFRLAFRNNKGIEGYWSYTTVDCGKAGTAYINDYSGNLVFNMPLASTASPTQAANLSYIYNSYFAKQKYTVTTPHTGRGWRMNIQQTVFPTTTDLLGTNQSKYPYVYTDADGTEHYFYKKTEGTSTQYLDEDGIGLELFVTSSYYKIVDEDKNSLVFNKSGYLTSICDSSNNRVEIIYSGKNIELIEDAEGDTITFTPNNTDNNYVKKITDCDGKNTTITFTGSYIGAVTYNDNTSVGFEYDDLGRLTSVTDVDGTKVVFGYSNNDSKGVTSVVEYSKNNLEGQKITFDRSKFNTTVVRSAGVDGVYGNSDDIVTEYQYDNTGKTTSSNSKTAGKVYLSASNATYTSSTPNSTGSNIKTLNKLKQSYSLGANRENLLVNHNLETTSSWSSAKWGANDTTKTVTFSVESNTEEYLYGKGSLEMHVSAVTGDARGRVYQDVSSNYIVAGKKYTLSCYVKTEDLQPVSGATNYGAVIAASLFYTNGDITDIYSSHINMDTEESINDGYRRISVTFEAPSGLKHVRVNLALRAATGTVYFDGVQLEKTEAASPYNFIENSDLERYNSNGLPTSWLSSNNFTMSTSMDTTTSNAKVEGTSCFRIKGEVGKNKYLYQEVPINTSEEATYILSGWATANSVPKGTNSSSFRLIARVYYTDGNYKNHNFYFNTDIKQGQWQYVSGAFNINDGSTTKEIDRLVVFLVYNRQGNYAYFDNIQLTKEDVTSYTYNDEGDLTAVKDNAEQNSSFKYQDNKLTEYVDPVGNKYEYEYDDNTKLVTSVKTPSGATFTYGYNGQGLATSVNGVGSDGNKLKATVNYNYTTDAGASEYTVTAYDQNGFSSSSTYDAQDGTLKETLSNNYNKVQYSYEPANDILLGITREEQSVSYDYINNFKNLGSIKHGDTTYSFSYDTFGNKVNTKAGSHHLINYVYGANNGSLQSVSFGRSSSPLATFNYKYDNYGNVSELRYGNNLVAEYFANNRGDVIRTKDHINGWETRATYDSTGRIISKDVLSTSGSTWLRGFEYDFDNNNNLTRFSYADNKGADNTVTYAYGDDTLLSDTNIHIVKSDGSEDVRNLHYEYDDLGRMTSKSLNISADGVDTAYTYVASDLRTGYTTTSIETEISDAFAYKYEYDPEGNIDSIRNGIKQSNDSYTFSNTSGNTYFYDEYNQLIQDIDLDNATVTYYTYNTSGNITRKLVRDWDIAGSFPKGVISDKTYKYEDTNGWADLLTSWGGQTITYDVIGNPLTYRDGITFTWKNGKELATFENDSVNVTYTYDAGGMRTAKNIVNADGTSVQVEYVYEGDQLLQMKYGNRVLDFIYDAEGKPVSIAYRNNLSATPTYYYYGLNARGDVEALYSSSGGITALYEYDAYGKLLSVKSTNGSAITTITHIANLNPLRYRGYVFDNETGLYYNATRYYDPTTCRFINADTTDVLTYSLEAHTDKNLYSYCDNNPIVREDASGAIWETPFDIVTIVISAVEVIIDPRDPMNWIGLAADVVDLIPFVTGVGEATRVVKISTKAVDMVDDAHDTYKAVDTAVDTTKKLHRPYIRKSTKEAVINAAPRTPDGLFIDPNTKLPIHGKYDLGHVPGHEFWRERDRAMSLGWSQKKFNDYMNRPEFYQIEDPLSNRSHKFEMKR